MVNNIDELICRLCGSKKTEFISSKLRNGEVGDVYQCCECSLRWLQLSEDSQINGSEFYAQEYATNYYKGAKTVVEKLFNKFFPYQEKRYERIAKFINTKGKFLEIGSGPGYFLSFIKDKVAEVVGVELNVEQADYSNQEKGIKTFSKDYKECGFANNSFDNIALFQVLEHIDKPQGFLTDLRDYLKDDGYLLIEVPSLSNPLVSLFKQQDFIDFWHQKPHLFYYNQHTLNKLLDSSGYDVVDTFVVQEVGLINHLNWCMTNGPMSSRTPGLKDIIQDDGRVDEVVDELDACYRVFEKQYCSILQKHGYGDILYCIAKKK